MLLTTMLIGFLGAFLNKAIEERKENPLVTTFCIMAFGLDLVWLVHRFSTQCHPEWFTDPC